MGSDVSHFNVSGQSHQEKGVGVKECGVGGWKVWGGGHIMWTRGWEVGVTECGLWGWEVGVTESRLERERKWTTECRTSHGRGMRGVDGGGGGRGWGWVWGWGVDSRGGLDVKRACIYVLELQTPLRQD